jgi:hypothetical protein
LKNKGCLMNFMDDEKVGSINDALWKHNVIEFVPLFCWLEDPKCMADERMSILRLSCMVNWMRSLRTMRRNIDDVIPRKYYAIINFCYSFVLLIRCEVYGGWENGQHWWRFNTM